ncbi:YjgN family protein [Schleiferilactobacillus harbinensis]|uniref:YjgN family protein n=1 Tax=Schleiferilactobacillus harbinensis TaxID=304207 RepID=UPI001169B1DB|nr:YjgN family protein [Schleiferilactobacillus harbinensis]GEK07449.1 membrane protein [Schleiferilactobacillus harbinensis]
MGFLVTVFTLGICYPWALTMIYGWRINHTVVDGHRTQFSGTALGLFGSWIKWLLLSIITIGIYSFWVRIKLENWRVSHTSFVN